MLNKVAMTPSPHIEINPEICNGRPVVAGSRITVDTILGYLSAGDSIDDVLGGYPTLTKESVLACIEYARKIGAIHSISLAA